MPAYEVDYLAMLDHTGSRTVDADGMDEAADMVTQALKDENSELDIEILAVREV